MTPYQRGNRDALLNIAAQLDARADASEKRYDDMRARLDRGRFAASTMHRTVVNAMLAHAVHDRDVAVMARRLAEALPEDPEEPTETAVVCRDGSRCVRPGGCPRLAVCARL